MSKVVDRILLSKGSHTSIYGIETKDTEEYGP